MTPRFEIGGRVRIRGSEERGMVYRMHTIGAAFEYDVYFSPQDTHTYAERDLTDDVDDSSVEGRLRNLEFLTAEEFRHSLTVLKLRRPLQQNLYSYLASRTQLQPYQFKPILKLLASPYGRIFIADEVGLGKTIEAGIVMSELIARAYIDRVLICCPPALVEKWVAELRERFDQEFDVLKGGGLRQALSDPARSEAPVKGVVSLHLLRRPEYVALLAESNARFHLVVVDESHHMQNPESRSFVVGEQLSERADHMLMLSATPLSLRTTNLFYQLQILVPEEFLDPAQFTDAIAPNAYLNEAVRALRAAPPRRDAARAALLRIPYLPHGPRFAGNPLFQEILHDLDAMDGSDAESTFSLRARINELNTIAHVFTRTRKREVQDQFPLRRAYTIDVRLSAEELEFYDAVTEHVRHTAEDGTVSFATIMPQRQVASSIPAARDYLAERWSGVALVEEDAASELELDEEAGAELPPMQSGTRLARAWRACEGIDSKFDSFWPALERLLVDGTARDGKVLVFSFFRKTIERLAHRLREKQIGGRRLRVSILYGPTPSEERYRIVEDFRTSTGPHVVISSEVAAEGLDFQFVNAIVNYDLPWNPMRVEQRIGRVDRYGQVEPLVHIFNFSVADTIEQRILERLYERIGIFEQAIGDLETILGDQIEELTRDLFRTDLTPAEQDERIRQVAENILRRKREQETFDEQAKSLMGQDDIFTEQLGRLESQRRYVGPDEIRNFTDVALRRAFPALRVTRTETDGIERISIPRGDDGVRRLVVDHLHRTEDRNARSWRCVPRIADGRDWDVTFEPQTASRDHNLDFLTLRHPLVRALLEREPSDLAPVTALAVANGERTRQLAFFVFLLTIRSFNPGLELVPVAVDLERGSVDPAVSAQLLELVQRARSWDGDDRRVDEDALASALEVARVFISTERQERQAELARISDQILDRRLVSLEQSHAQRLAHQQYLLEEAEATNNPIARVRRATIRQLEDNLRRKREEIQAQRGVTIGSDLVAGGLLKLTGR